MSHNINDFHQASQSGYKWELFSLKRIYGTKKSTLDLLPLERIPILTYGCHYAVRLKGVWQGASQAWRKAQLPDVTLKSRDQACCFVKKDSFILGNVILLTASLTATASFSVKVNTSSLTPRWYLLVSGQIVLQNLRVISRGSRFSVVLWQAQKRWRIHKTWQKTRFLEGHSLYFSSVLRRECEENTELWQRLIAEVVRWAESGKSKEARSVRAELGIAAIWASHTSRPFLTPSVTNEYRGIPGAMQGGFQLTSAKLSQLSCDRRATISSRSISLSQAAHPVVGKFNSCPVSTQRGKRKSPSLTAVTNVQKRQRTLFFARSTQSARMPIYVPLARTFSLPTAVAPISVSGFSLLQPSGSSFPANQRSSVDQAPEADIEEYLGEDEMQSFLQENSVDLTQLPAG